VEYPTVLVIGHRGAAGNVAENTVGSISYALSAGADGIEFDVRMLENRFIVLHDETLERTTDGHGPYKAMNLPALRRLTANNGEAIPFLEEILALVAHRTLVNIEIKESGIAPEVVLAVNAFLPKLPNWHGRMVYSSFDQQTTTELAARVGDKQLGILCDTDYDAALAQAQQLDAYSLHLPIELVNPDTVQQAHDCALQVYVYTVNHPSDLEHCANCAVDGVFTDYPSRALRFTQQRVNLAR
jgi:glycerophosphoryl diester phosphodiesterase